MFCRYHPDRIAIDKCFRCHHPICKGCQKIVKGVLLCPSCASLPIPGVTWIPHRNPVFAALLSFLFPGAGQVYNGEVGKGIFILLTFWLVGPWAYGIIDAYRVARAINYHKIATRLSIGDFVEFIIAVVIVLFIGFHGTFYMMHRAEQRQVYQTRAALTALSHTLERYAAIHGWYPEAYVPLLADNETPMNEIFCGQTVNGYDLTCQFSTEGYQIVAEPLLEKSGRPRFVLSTGGVLKRQ